MKKNVVVLDFDGLFSYPEFSSRIIEPLVEDGREIVIWTFNAEKQVRQKLERMGISDFAKSVRIIDSYKYELLRNRLKEVQEGIRSAEDGRFIQNLLQDPEISPSEETVVRAIKHFQALIQYEGGNKTYKYPPLLGENNYLLVESDRAMGLKGPLRRINPNAEMSLAYQSGYSIIMVPEHPYSWIESVYPPVGVTPEQVMDTLVPIVLNWSGEPIRRDLAVEFGIFQESEGYHQEQIGRPPERL